MDNLHQHVHRQRYYPSTTYVECRVLKPWENPSLCTVTVLTWAALVFTFITVQLIWWIFDLPLVWKSGFKVFLDTIPWQCVHAYQPGSVGFIAAAKGFDTAEFARIYYLGLKRKDNPPTWTNFTLSKALVTDMSTVVGTAIMLYHECMLPNVYKPLLTNISPWLSPSLPAALIGLRFLLEERTIPRTRAGNYYLLLYTTLVLLLVGASIALALWKSDRRNSANSGDWYFSKICYVFTIVPTVAFGRALILAITRQRGYCGA